MALPADRDIRERRNVWPILLRLVDCIVILGTYSVACWLLGQDVSELTFAAGSMACLFFLFFAELTSIYRVERAAKPDRDLAIVALNWICTLALLLVCAFLLKMGANFSRVSFVVWALLGLSVLAWARMCLRAVLETCVRNPHRQRRFAIAGMNPLGVQLAQRIQNNPLQGLSFVGFFDDRIEGRRCAISDGMPGYQGKLIELIERAKEGEIATVFITLPMRAENRIRSLLDQLSDSTISVYIVPDFFVFELLHSRWTNLGGIPAVSVFETPLYGVDGWAKRFLDVLAASAALIAASPVMIAIALIIKLTSPGPVFFRQKRYGLDGREIWVWKFRSMKVCDNGPFIQQATKGDPRITPFGAFIRKTSLDELPQLFNVLQGNMSMVGPRPHATAHNEQYRRLIRGYMLRHKVKPGITGLAQVEGFRGETDTLYKMEKRVELDHRYIREWSIWLDLKILFKTFWVVWKQPTAY
jgi:putative colanic acid biosynthesis UDP-glucose lipid carrier transferase